MSATVFVTGTDTGVGKTLVACAMLRWATAEGLRACGFKPVASGCEQTWQGLRSADVLAMQAIAGGNEAYRTVNPYAFEPPIAPHLAAQQGGVRVSVTRLAEAHRDLAARYELIVAEGAGGWLVPLDETWTLGAWVAEQDWPVVLVVGVRLGCINHALLSAEAIARRTRLLGWVANVLPPVPAALGDTIAALQSRLSAPLLGVVPEGADAAAATAALTLTPLLSLVRPPPAPIVLAVDP